MSAMARAHDALAELAEEISRLEDEVEEARDKGFEEGEASGLAAGEQDVARFVKALIDDVDRRRRQAELPLPLHPGVMSLDQVEKMILKFAKEVR